MATDWDGVPRCVEHPAHVALVAIMLSAALGACMVGHRIAAVLMLGAVGYAMSALYVVQGAPDLALTQFAIETLSTVLFVLVLRFLPRSWSHGPPACGRPVRIAVGARGRRRRCSCSPAVGQARSDVEGPSTADVMIEGSAAAGQGQQRRQRDPRRLPRVGHDGRDHGAARRRRRRGEPGPRRPPPLRPVGAGVRGDRR